MDREDQPHVHRLARVPRRGQPRSGPGVAVRLVTLAGIAIAAVLPLSSCTHGSRVSEPAAGARELSGVDLDPAILFSPEMRFFPGDFFDSTARWTVQQRAMDQWPGPFGLAEMWGDARMGVPHKTALLVGAAAHHDPGLLPLYREAIVSDQEEVRRAAAYGYRDLIGDQLPNLSRPIDDRSAAMLAAEMEAVESTARRSSLVALWLESALRTEGRTFGDFQGVVLERPASVCFRAVDRLMTPWDLSLLLEAYRASGDLNNRITLITLVEGLTLHEFVDPPQGDRAAWGPRLYREGVRDFENWLDRWSRHSGCDGPEVEEILKMALRTRDDPFAPDACHTWQRVLRDGEPEWWGLAAQQLYRCGGPWTEVSVLRASSPEMTGRRDALAGWYRLYQEKLEQKTERARRLMGE